MNPFNEYYTSQAGSGFSPFQGYQYQRGHGFSPFQGYQYQYGNGFFGTLFQNIIKPFGKYLGKQILRTGVDVGSDMLSGENFKTSVKKQIKSTGNRMMSDGAQKLQTYAQGGSGRRHKKKKSTKKKTVVRKTLKRKVIKKRKTKKRVRKQKFSLF